MAEDERFPVTPGESRDFAINPLQAVGAFDVVGTHRFWPRCQRFALSLCDSPPTDPDTDSPGDAIKPTPERALGTDRPRVLDQREECGLKGVVGIAAGAQYPPTHTQNHGSVPTYQNVEGGGVAIGFELPKQFAVRAVCQALAHRDAADIVKEFVKDNCHAGPPFRRCSTLIECADAAKRPGK
jgi:hypothetical protein